MMPKPKFLVVHPGATFSTHDVHVGVVEGLRAQGIEVAEFRLDGRIERNHQFLHFLWRQQRKAERRKPESERKAWPKPTPADVLYQASSGLVERALQKRCTDVLVISAMFLQPDRLELCRRAGLRVWLLCTESPYDLVHEKRIASLVDGCWTNERTSVSELAQVTNAAYLPHAYRAGVHDRASMGLPHAYDVLFCGSLFDERIKWFEAVEWTGIDLAIFGTTELLSPESPIFPYVRGGMVPNEHVVDLMQRSKITINLFRDPPAGMRAESLNPRCYEAPMSGTCLVSDYRAEIGEVFGGSVPVVSTPETTGDLVRSLLSNTAMRVSLAASARAAVASATWRARAEQMLSDIDGWRSQALPCERIA